MEIQGKLALVTGAASGIGNTASIAALGPLPNDPIYAATKAAVVRFTESCGPLANAEAVLDFVRDDELAGECRVVRPPD